MGGRPTLIPRNTGWWDQVQQNHAGRMRYVLDGVKRLREIIEVEAE
jgi:hypothetical protein